MLCFSMISIVSLAQPDKQWFPKVISVFLYDAKKAYCISKDWFCIQAIFSELVHLPECFSEFLTLPLVTRSRTVGVWQSCFSSDLHAFDYLICCSVSVGGCPSLCQIWVFSSKMFSFICLTVLKQRHIFLLSRPSAVTPPWPDLVRCWCLRTHPDLKDASISTAWDTACSMTALLSLLRGERGNKQQLIDGCDQISPMNHLVAARCVSVLLFSCCIQGWCLWLWVGDHFPSSPIHLAFLPSFLETFLIVIDVLLVPKLSCLFFR